MGVKTQDIGSIPILKRDDSLKSKLVKVRNLGFNLLLHKISNEKFADMSSPRARAGQDCSNGLDIQWLKAVIDRSGVGPDLSRKKPNKEEQD